MYNTTNVYLFIHGNRWCYNRGEDVWSNGCPKDYHWPIPQRDKDTESYCWKSWLFPDFCFEASERNVVWTSKMWQKEVHQQEGRPQPRRKPWRRAGLTIWARSIKSEQMQELAHRGLPRTDGFREWGTTAKCPAPSLFSTPGSVTSGWHEPRRSRSGVLLRGPKCCFPMKVSFVSRSETKVAEFGGGLERHRTPAVWSPGSSSRSQCWFGVPCHPQVLDFCVFSGSQWTEWSTRRSWRTSCCPQLKGNLMMRKLCSSRIWHLHTVENQPLSGLLITSMCFLGQVTHRTWTPSRIYGV